MKSYGTWPTVFGNMESLSNYRRCLLGNTCCLFFFYDGRVFWARVWILRNVGSLRYQVNSKLTRVRSFEWCRTIYLIIIIISNLLWFELLRIASSENNSYKNIVNSVDKPGDKYWGAQELYREWRLAWCLSHYHTLLDCVWMLFDCLRVNRKKRNFKL